LPVPPNDDESRMSETTSEQSLKDLMLRSLDGDEAAYRRLLTVLRTLLVGYFGRRLGPAVKADMEDLVQDTLMALHARRATYDRDRPFTAWFFTIARYKLVDHFRSRGGRVMVSVDALEEIEDGFSEEAISARMDVERLLAQLPEKQQALIRQVRLEGQSIADTAEKSGQSESLVKVSIHRGIKALAERLRGTRDPEQ
jgi:RNA polymerase sigma-70 factor (ECF subfamily)